MEVIMKLNQKEKAFIKRIKKLYMNIPFELRPGEHSFYLGFFYGNSEAAVPNFKLRKFENAESFASYCLVGIEYDGHAHS
jgi:hypothetical protein